jgi:HSP20 family molecular chaperone IbpA
MQNKANIILASVVGVAALGLLGYQSWNTHQLQQQVVALQQQLAAQTGAGSGQSAPGAPPLASPPNATPPQSNPPLVPPAASPLNPPARNDPFWGGQDPFADMQRMQQQMHQHMQDLLSGLGFDQPDTSLFGMDPFQRGLGFGSSMGFGDDPKFDFKENVDNYQVTIAIPKGSKVEITTSVHGRDLTVEGRVTVEQQNQNKGQKFRSLQTRQFARTFSLPADVDVLGIRNETVGEQAVITLPKQAKRPKL